MARRIHSGPDRITDNHPEGQTLFRASLTLAPNAHKKRVHTTDSAAVDAAAAAAAELEVFAERWNTRYPAIVRLWRTHWADFVPFLAFSPR